MTTDTTALNPALEQFIRKEVVKQYNRSSVTTHLLRKEVGMGKNLAWDVSVGTGTGQVFDEGQVISVFNADTEVLATLPWAEYGDAFKIFVPTMYEPRMAPPGSQIVILQRIMEIDFEGVEDWTGHKCGVQADLLDRFEAVLPGIRDHIVTVQSASALTSWRFTLNLHGAMLGWEMSPDQLGASRPGIEGPVRNLHLTGHWTRPGGGITPVIVSAGEAARAIITGR